MYCKFMYFYLKWMKVDMFIRSFKNSLDMDFNQCGVLYVLLVRNLLFQGKSKLGMKCIILFLYMCYYMDWRFV